MDRSKRFYHDVLGLDVVADFGANVTLDGGVVLQMLDTWKSFIRTDHVVLPNHAGELYFEADDIDGFRKHLESFDIRLVHPLFEHPWGQRVIRFYDPDGHVIEVGEKMDSVILRFANRAYPRRKRPSGWMCRSPLSNHVWTNNDFLFIATLVVASIHHARSAPEKWKLVGRGVPAEPGGRQKSG